MTEQSAFLSILAWTSYSHEKQKEDLLRDNDVCFSDITASMLWENYCLFS